MSDGGTSIYVGHTPDNTSSEGLETLFSKYGNVKKVDVKSGFAFVLMEDSGDAAEAIKNLDGTDFNGSKISVAESKPRGEREKDAGIDYKPNPAKCIRITNLAYEVHWQDLKDHFKKIGDVARADVDRDGPKSMGTGMIEMKKHEDVKRAIEELDGSTLSGRKIKCSKYVKDGKEGKESRDKDRDRSRSRSRDRKKSDRRDDRKEREKSRRYSRSPRSRSPRSPRRVSRRELEEYYARRYDPYRRPHYDDHYDYVRRGLSPLRYERDYRDPYAIPPPIERDPYYERYLAEKYSYERSLAAAARAEAIPQRAGYPPPDRTYSPPRARYPPPPSDERELPYRAGYEAYPPPPRASRYSPGRADTLELERRNYAKESSYLDPRLRSISPRASHSKVLSSTSGPSTRRY